MDRCVDQSSTLDNKRKDCDIEDDEHRYDHAHHKHCLKIHMEQVENKSPREDHKCRYHQLLSGENNHNHYLTNMAHIETCDDMFAKSLELSRNEIND
jgi:hypothetical protein